MSWLLLFYCQPSYNFSHLENNSFNASSLSNYLTFSFPFIASFSLSWAVFIYWDQHFILSSNSPAQFSKSNGLPIFEFILLFWVFDVPYFLCSLRWSHQHNSFVFFSVAKMSLVHAPPTLGPLIVPLYLIENLIFYKESPKRER